MKTAMEHNRIVYKKNRSQIFYDIKIGNEFGTLIKYNWPIKAYEIAYKIFRSSRRFFQDFLMQTRGTDEFWPRPLECTINLECLPRFLICRRSGATKGSNFNRIDSIFPK